MKRRPSARYWTLVGLLILFGIVTGFSIGIPFLLLGFVLVALAPLRQRAELFWPLLAAGSAFVAVYVVLSPIGCESFVQTSDPPFTTCTNPIGIEYSGWGDYNPSHIPALLAGAAAAALSGALTRSLIRRAQSATASGESHPLGK